eukprot:g35199.t1
MVHHKSPLFKELHSSIFHRLDHEGGMHVFVDHRLQPQPLSQQPIWVNLHRHRLDFRVDRETGIVESKQYHGMKIAQEQRFGALLHLRKFLLLEKGEGNLRECLLLIPEGKIRTGPNGIVGLQFPEVISGEEAGKDLHYLETAAASMGFYAYNVDDRLRCLRDSLEEEFTGLSGLDMALQNLRMCWSNQPYDAKSVELLQRIASSAPERNTRYISGCRVEETKWPHLPHSTELARSDVLYLLPWLMQNRANRLSQLHPKRKVYPAFFETKDVALYVRGYFQFMNRNASSSRLTEEEVSQLQRLGLWPVSKSVKAFQPSAGPLNMCKLLWGTKRAQSELLPPEDLRQFCSTDGCFDRATSRCVPHSNRVTSWLSFLDKDPSRVLFPLLTRAKLVAADGDASFKRLPSFQDGLSSIFLLEMSCAPRRGYVPLGDSNELPGGSKLQEQHRKLKEANELNEFFDKVNAFLEDATSCEASVSELPKATLNKYLNCFVKGSHTSFRSARIDSLTSLYEPDEKLASRARKVSSSGRDEEVDAKFGECVESAVDSAFRPVARIRADFAIFKAQMIELIDSEDVDELVLLTSLSQRRKELQLEEKQSQEAKPMRGPCPLQFKGFEADYLSQSVIGDLVESWEQLSVRNGAKLASNAQHTLVKLLKLALQREEEHWQQICNFLRPGPSAASCIESCAELRVSTAPTSLLSVLISKNSFISPALRDQLVTWCVYSSYIQKAQRCIRALAASTASISAVQETNILIDDLLRKRCDGWTPADHNGNLVKFLTFELQEGIFIWNIQSLVAKQMIDMDNATGQVLQLNMGQGKTSVIFPILCSFFSSPEDDRVARLVVLDSLYESNLEALRIKLGFLLRLSIYVFPMERSISLKPDLLKEITKQLEDVRKAGGVLLATTDHILSLSLRYMEQLNKDDAEEVLGGSQSPSGGPQRWEMPMAIMEVLQANLQDIVSKVGPEHFEIESGETKSGCWKQLRFLPTSEVEFKQDAPLESIGAFQHLCTIMLQYLRKSQDRSVAFIPQISSTKWPKENFLLNRDKEVFMHEIRRLLGEDFWQAHETKLLELRGLLGLEILRLILERRHNIDYGIDPGRPSLQMAVPYRAKNKPSPRAEFNHLAVKICFSLTDHYKRGLTMEQVRKVIEHLEAGNSQSSDREYDYWMENSFGVPDVFRSRQGLNFEDASQFQLVYPILQHNMRIINNWLAHFQKDLYELKHTNAHVLDCILSANSEQDPAVVILERWTSRCSDIVDHAVACGARVILDPGALIKDLHNKAVAELWLKTEPKAEGALFFDETNRMQVLQSKGFCCDLDESPLLGRIDTCVVYIDDSHTRGTDIWMPTPMGALVTLGPRLCKDKLSQPCMRMRQLGIGHTLTFAAPFEVG